MPRLTIFLALAALAATAPVVAQDVTEPTAPARPCDAAEYHQFDFWLGDWNVSSGGQVAGRNAVEAIQRGCVIQENWKGSGLGGLTGTSFNLYDRDTGQWHQTWVDASGTLLQLDGGLVDGSMVLEGERPSAAGNGSTLHRISWTPNPDASVRQLWEASQDGGRTWKVIFDGHYTRASRFE